jgi:hypothetical protein
VRLTRVLASLAECDSELDQAIAVLEEAGIQDVGTLPISHGDRVLVALAQQVTGRAVELVARCPRCELLNAVSLAPDQLPATTPRFASLGPGGVREPTYGDLLDLPTDSADAVAELVARCTVGEPLREPTAADLELVDDTLSGPIDLACAECDQPISVDADVQQVALARLAECARELERDVHLLADAYGWSLAEIEALPDARRRYLATLVSEARR